MRTITKKMPPLETYEQNFPLIYSELEQSLKSLENASATNKPKLFRESNELLDELKEILDNIETEVILLASDLRASHNLQFTNFKKQYQASVKRLKELQDSENRNALFGDNSSSKNANSGISAGNQRQSLLKNNASLARTSDRLMESQRIANETGDIGANILNNLRGQREQLLNSRNTLLEADGYVDRSLQTLKVMSRRLAANKMISYCIIAVLILLILLVLFSKFS